jgi:hypothetical protein
LKYLYFSRKNGLITSSPMLQGEDVEISVLEKYMPVPSREACTEKG